MSLLTRRCTQCGDKDRLRFVGGVVEVLGYLAGGILAVCLVVYAAAAFL
jgi:hypothetical protein